MSSPSIALNTRDTPINPLIMAVSMAIAVTGLLNREMIGAMTMERTPPIIMAKNLG